MITQTAAAAVNVGDRIVTPNGTFTITVADVDVVWVDGEPQTQVWDTNNARWDFIGTQVEVVTP